MAYRAAFGPRWSSAGVGASDDGSESAFGASLTVRAPALADLPAGADICHLDVPTRDAPESSYFTYQHRISRQPLLAWWREDGADEALPCQYGLQNRPVCTYVSIVDNYEAPGYQLAKPTGERQRSATERRTSTWPQMGCTSMTSRPDGAVEEQLAGGNVELDAACASTR